MCEQEKKNYTSEEEIITEKKNQTNCWKRLPHRTFHLVYFVLFRFFFSISVDVKFRGDYYDFSQTQSHLHSVATHTPIHFPVSSTQQYV